MIASFVKANPYPTPQELTKITTFVANLGFKESNVSKFYWKEVVKLAYDNLNDNDVITLCGLKMKFPKKQRTV